FLLPLQEVLVNSIQSIEDRENTESGKIILTVLRKNEPSLGLNDDSEPIYNPIIGFTIKDNGVGFTDARFEAFRTPYTDYGTIKHGCKGIGRYTVLACFGSMDIESYYKDGDKIEKRLIKFDSP